MLKSLFGGDRKRAVASQVAFTLRSELSLHGKVFEQTQFATEHYVASELRGRLVLFRADTGERYAVDRDARQLTRMDLGPQVEQMRRFRAALGDVALEPTGEVEEVDGRPARRLTLRSESPQMVLDGEFLAVRVPGIERTALHRERSLDEQAQPFRMSLEPDEVMARSQVMVLAAGAEQNQSLRLLSVEEGIDGLEELDALLAYRIVS